MSMQVVEVAIGVIAAFVAVSMIASAVVSAIALIMKKRSKDLESVILQMIGDPEAAKSQFNIYETSVFETFQIASRRKRGPRSDKDKRNPSFVSAKSFADAAIEKLAEVKRTVDDGAARAEALLAKVPAGPFKKRLTVLIEETGGELVGVKAGLESWFDDTMDRLEGSFKRWSQWSAAIVGIFFALLLNVSAVRVVDALWSDAVLHGAVADAADQYVQNLPPPKPGEETNPFEQIQSSIQSLDSLKLPIGWSDGWSDESGAGWTILGCLLTGAAAMLGTQFWLGLLTRLISVRGGIPPKAGDDPSSASRAVTAAGGPGLSFARGGDDPFTTFAGAVPSTYKAEPKKDA